MAAELLQRSRKFRWLSTAIHLHAPRRSDRNEWDRRWRADSHGRDVAGRRFAGVSLCKADENERYKARVKEQSIRQTILKSLKIEKARMRSAPFYFDLVQPRGCASY